MNTLQQALTNARTDAVRVMVKRKRKSHTTAPSSAMEVLLTSSHPHILTSSAMEVIPHYYPTHHTTIPHTLLSYTHYCPTQHTTILHTLLSSIHYYPLRWRSSHTTYQHITHITPLHPAEQFTVLRVRVGVMARFLQASSFLLLSGSVLHVFTVSASRVHSVYLARLSAFNNQLIHHRSSHWPRLLHGHPQQPPQVLFPAFSILSHLIRIFSSATQFMP